MPTDIERISIATIDGKPSSLADYAGKVRLIVNVASKCGHTPQYAGLEALYKKYKDKGFEVLGFPANEFGAQEPGTEAEIKAFCSSKYNVTFPMFAKIVVKGPGQHELYKRLTTDKPGAGATNDITWNFEKFLIDRHGVVVDRFAPSVAPDAEPITSALERELART